MLRKMFVALAAAGIVLGVGATEAEAKVLNCRTLAPSGSKWATVLTKAAHELKEKTGGGVEVHWTWNGGGRGEEAMVPDLKNGSLDCAAMTAVGLGQFVKDYLLFNLPGLFSSWGQLDAVRNETRDYFEGRFKKEGVILAGFSDIGAGKIMGTSDKYEDEIWRPENLKGKGLFTAPGDPVGPELFRTISATATTVPIPEVMGKLGSSINTVITAPYAAVQLQWASRIKYILRGITPGFLTGGLVIAAPSFNSLPADHQKVTLEVIKQYADELTKTIRGEDAGAYALISRQVVRKHDATPEEKKQWSDTFDKVRMTVGPQNFSAEARAKVCKGRC
jgi:TRAP-type C4-dicarboxylate transport system substrate-binding protein